MQMRQCDNHELFAYWSKVYGIVILQPEGGEASDLDDWMMIHDGISSKAFPYNS